MRAAMRFFGADVSAPYTDIPIQQKLSFIVMCPHMSIASAFMARGNPFPRSLQIQLSKGYGFPRSA